MRRKRRQTGRSAAGCQDGSALVLVLLFVLLLTALALGLAMATEIEMQLGGSERVLVNNGYAAESGIHTALAAIAVTQDWAGEDFAVAESVPDSGWSIGHRVTTSRVQAVGPPQAPPLTIANQGQNDYHTFTVVLSSVAQRVSWPASEPSPIYEEGDARENDVTIQSQTLRSVHYFLSPIQTPTSPESLYNADEVTKIH